MPAPNHSPVTATCIERATEEVSNFETPSPKRISQLLDEVALEAAQMPDYPESIIEFAEEVSYLHIYKQGRLMFLSGLYPTQWLSKWLPDCTEVEREAVETALKLYAQNDGFRVSYPDMVTPIALRINDPDEIIMTEPGPVDPARGRPDVTE